MNGSQHNNQIANLSLEQLLEAPKSSVFEVRLKQSGVLREAGNQAFEQNFLDTAIKLYNRALFHADFEKSQYQFSFGFKHKIKIQESLAPCYLNLARCYMKERLFRNAIKHSQKSIDCFCGALSAFSEAETSSHISSNSCLSSLFIFQSKAYFIKAKAMFELSEYENSRLEIEKLIEHYKQFEFDKSDDATSVKRIVDSVDSTESENIDIAHVLEKTIKEANMLLAKIDARKRRDNLEDRLAWVGKLKISDENDGKRNFSKQLRGSIDFAIKEYLKIQANGVLNLVCGAIFVVIIFILFAILASYVL